MVMLSASDGMEFILISFQLKMELSKGVYSALCYTMYILMYRHVGCYIELNVLGALAQADYVVLLAPTPSANRKLLFVCFEFAREHYLISNGNKSECNFFPGTENNGHETTTHGIQSLQVVIMDIE